MFLDCWWASQRQNPRGCLGDCLWQWCHYTEPFWWRTGAARWSSQFIALHSEDHLQPWPLGSGRKDNVAGKVAEMRFLWWVDGLSLRGGLKELGRWQGTQSRAVALWQWKEPIEVVPVSDEDAFRTNPRGVQEGLHYISYLPWEHFSPQRGKAEGDLK